MGSHDHVGPELSWRLRRTSSELDLGYKLCPLLVKCRKAIVINLASIVIMIAERYIHIGYFAFVTSCQTNHKGIFTKIKISFFGNLVEFFLFQNTTFFQRFSNTFSA